MFHVEQFTYNQHLFALKMFHMEHFYNGFLDI